MCEERNATGLYVFIYLYVYSVGMFIMNFHIDSQLKNAILISGVSLTYWLSIVFYREYIGRDVLFLRKNVIAGCNGWCIGHFFHYLALGYFSPKYFRLFIVLGIAFEFLEMWLNNFSQYIDCKLVEDTITNTAGVLSGVFLSNMFPNKVDLYKTIVG